MSGSTSIPATSPITTKAPIPATSSSKVKHLVRNVHLKDNRGGFEDWYFPAVGDGGAVDFARVRADP